jgi:hypothetical protein
MMVPPGREEPSRAETFRCLVPASETRIDCHITSTPPRGSLDEIDGALLPRERPAVTLPRETAP